MKKVWFLVLIAAIGLGGCAGLTQFPEVPKDYNTALLELDTDYATTLRQISGADTVEQKKIRSAMMERRMAVIDAYFKEFQAGLVKENVQAELGIALVGVGVGAAGSLVAETASQILSAVSGGLAGAQAAYGKAALYDKTMSALLAQMQAGRKAVAAQIYQRWNLDLDKYPLWMARMDLDAYYFAGSLPGAILATAADAKVKETEADEQIKLVRSGDFTTNLAPAKAIGVRLKNLTPAQALALAKTMEPNIEKRSDKLIAIMDALDPSKERLKDGQTAKEKLFKWQVFDDRDATSMKQWTDALDVVEQMSK